MDLDNTNTLSALSAAVSAFSAFVSAAFTIAVWRVYRQQRTDQAFMTLYFYLQNEDLRRARGTLRRSQEGKPSEPTAAGTPLAEGERSEVDNAAAQVLSSFQVAARFVERRLVSKRIVKEYYGDNIVQCYDAAPEKVQQYAPWASLRKFVNELKKEGFGGTT